MYRLRQEGTKAHFHEKHARMQQAPMVEAQHACADCKQIVDFEALYRIPKHVGETWRQDRYKWVCANCRDKSEHTR